MPTVQVFEHESLFTFPNKNGFSISPSQLDQLYRFNDQNGNKYFTGIRQGIRFNSYVGVIKVGNLTIEILPKIDRPLSQGQDDIKFWRTALIQMLRICRKISIESLSEATLAKKDNSILEIYIHIFLDEIENLLRSGLIKKYRTTSGNLYAWKGRMDFGRNIQQNLIHQERFFTHHQVFDHEHLINQILLKALYILNSLAQNSSLKDRTMRNLLNFPEINQIQILPEHFNQIKESRKTKPYKKALEAAKMIILNFSPDIISGQENMLALLFDMNKLWEEYIFHMLLLTNFQGYNIIYQDGKNFWEKRKIKPDFVIEQTLGDDKTSIFLIDTKWRVPDNNEPTDDELKQMYAYNMYWEAESSLLLYPEVLPQNEVFGKFHKGRNSENSCKAAYVSIFNEDGTLNMEIGKVILEKFKL